MLAAVGGVDVECQIDSGADRHILRRDLYERINSSGKFPLRSTKVCLKGSGGPITTLGSVTLPTSISGVEYNLDFLVVPTGDLPSPILIGDPVLDVADVRLTRNGPVFEPIVGEAYIQHVQVEVMVPLGDIADTLPADYKDRIKKLILDYVPLKSAKCPVQLTIEVTDQKSVVSRPRRLSPGEEECIRQLLEDWEARGIVRKGTSQYASAIVPVWKKDGTIRICIDYKRLNKIVCRLHFPMPLIEDALDGTEGSIFSSCLDLKDGFFHVDVAEDSQKYLAFVTRWAQYIPLVAPFGFCNSPEILPRWWPQCSPS